MQITIKELQTQWGVARSTVYKHIKQGLISRLDNGLIDVAEVVRVYGEPSQTTQRNIKKSVIDNAETAILKEKIAFLESQLAQAEKREEWLKGQVETTQETIKLLEHKQSAKKGLFGRLLGAINQE